MKRFLIVLASTAWGFSAIADAGQHTGVGGNPSPNPPTVIDDLPPVLIPTSVMPLPALVSPLFMLSYASMKTGWQKPDAAAMGEGKEMGQDEATIEFKY